MSTSSRMLLRFHIPNLFSRSVPLTNTIINAIRSDYLNSNPLCTINESTQFTDSPELPDWVKFFDTKNPIRADSDDEDFVIPSLANWVEAQKLENHGKVVKRLFSDTGDNEVDKISEVLKNRYNSPEDVAKALDGCGFTASESLLEQVLKRFSNDWIRAFGVFTWAKTQTGYVHAPELYNSMVDILGKTKKFQLMWELVHKMNLKGDVSLVTITKVIRRLSRAGMFKEAIEAFRGIEQFGLSKSTESINVLMDALVKGNSVEDTYSMFVEFKDKISLNLSSFNVLIHGWCKARKLDNARETMEEMEKHGFHPDVVSYTSLIEAYCREKDFQRANQLLEEMKVKGCTPNTITYTILMHGLGKAKQINDALDVYEKMKMENCDLDASFYSSLIYVLGQTGRIKDAKDVFEDMKKQGLNPDTLTYNTLISCVCSHSEEETALGLLRKMEDDSCKPNIETYHPLLKMCCRKKRMKVLKFLLIHMFKNDVSIDVGTYSLLVRGLCKNGKVELACSFFGEMVSKGMVPKDSTFKMLMEELERKSAVKEKEHIEKLMSIAKEQERMFQDYSATIQNGY